MIQHYLKMAFRQILKNKTQYSLSIIGIAIGLLCFSITSYYIRRYNNQFTAWPNSARIAKVYTQSTHSNQLDMTLPGKVLQALMSNPPAGIEKITFSGDYYSAANITFSGTDKDERCFECSFREIAPDFIDIFSIVTTDGRKPSIRPGEVLITRSAADKIFGKEDPVGKKIHFTRADNDTTSINYSTISAVIKDLPDGPDIRQDLYFPHSAPINPDRSYWNSITVLLAEGVSSQEVNKRLKAHIPLFGEKNDRFILVKTLSDEMMNPESITTTLLIPAIGALVLLAAMINFLKFCIQSFYNRTRELSIRKSLGSSIKGFFYLLFTEIGILFLFATLLCFILTEWFIPVFYQYLQTRNMIHTQITIHLPTLFRQESEYLILLFMLCASIAAWAILRMRNYSLTEGIKGGKRNKPVVRNFMMGIQLFICFLFIGGSVGLNMFHKQLNSHNYHTLTHDERERILRINLWNPQLRGHEEEIINQIRALSGVEDIQTTLERSTPAYKTSKDETINGIEHQVSANYNRFMKLPLEGRMPVSSNEIAISRSLAWILEEEGENNPSSIQLGDKLYQITGVFEQIPFEPLYTKEQLAKSNPYKRIHVISITEKPDYRTNIYIKCTPKQVAAIQKEIVRIVRKRLPETIPFEIITLENELFKKNGGAIVIGDLFALLSIISLAITILGIYSAISLDTQGRQKEVAIRKVNGAGVKSIAMLFGKLYIHLLFLAAIPSLLLVYIFLKSVAQEAVVLPDNWLNNPFMWLGILLLTGGIVFVTIAWRIWVISRINPAEIIKAE